MYVNDLPDAVEENNIAIFADDTKIYKEVKSAADVVSLQSDLNRLDPWSKDSGLTFNETKCKAHRISRNLKPIESSYSIKGKVLESVVTERDLGVFVANDLTWSKRVFEQSCGANKLLGYIRRNTGFIRSTDVRRSVYLTLFRPHFGYATQIWAPQSIELITRIERTQRRTIKYILKLPFPCTISYMDRLKTLDLLSLTFWHKYLDMVFFFKIIHGLLSVEPSIIPKARITRPTRSSSSGVIKLVEPKCQTATYQKTYIIRCIRVWNVVADELNLRMNTLNDFKQATVEYYKTALSNYDFENPRTFKSVCLKCNKCPSLAQPVSCCF